MEVVDAARAREWLEEAGVTVVDLQPRAPHLSAHVSYRVPGDSGKKTAIARTIANVFPEESNVLVWITETGVWPSAENLDLFYGYRASLGEPSPLDIKPAHLVTGADKDVLVSLLSMVLYFVWGAVVSDDQSRLLLHISHDEIIEAQALPTCEGREALDALSEILPSEDDG